MRQPSAQTAELWGPYVKTPIRFDITILTLSLINMALSMVKWRVGSDETAAHAAVLVFFEGWPSIFTSLWSIVNIYLYAGRRKLSPIYVLSGTVFALVCWGGVYSWWWVEFAAFVNEDQWGIVPYGNEERLSGFVRDLETIFILGSLVAYLCVSTAALALLRHGGKQKPVQLEPIASARDVIAESPQPATPPADIEAPPDATPASPGPKNVSPGSPTRDDNAPEASSPFSDPPRYTSGPAFEWGRREPDAELGIMAGK